MQFNSHRRSFVGTTILAIFSSIALIILVDQETIYVPWWAIRQHLLPEWGIWLLVGLAAVALSALAAAAALVATAVSSSSIETSAKSAEYHIFQFDRASELLVR